MSSFFNKKEEVIEVELTQYGKHLLSKGEFAPVYYSFFDDDVTYDWEYTGSTAEEQNYAQDRILEETPSPKVQYVFSGRETIVSNINQHIRNNRIGIRDKKVQQTPEKHYALSAPLGNSSFNTSHAPSWTAQALEGRFTASVRYQQGAQPTLKIPQLDMDTVYCRTRCMKDTMPDEESTTGSPVNQAGDGGSAGSSGELGLATMQYPDGSYIDISCDHVLLEIGESNTECLKENFDIEVFLVEDVEMNGNIKTPNHSTPSKVEKLTPLKFGRRFSNIINGILTDDIEPPPNYSYDPTFVEHYLDIRVDKEIDKQILCSAGVKPDARKCGGLSATYLECDESEMVGKIYKSTSSGPYGDDC